MDQFLHLKCAGDVLNAFGHPVRSPEREIVRAMACLRLLRPGVKPSPSTMTGNPWGRPTVPLRLVTFGSENSLLAILAAHVLAYKEVIEIGEEPPQSSNLNIVYRLLFRRGNFYEPWVEHHLAELDTPVVLASAHATPRQAERAVELYRKSAWKVQQLVLVLERFNGVNGIQSKLLSKEIGRTTAWAVEHGASIRADVFRDTYIPQDLGPRVILHARQRGTPEEGRFEKARVVHTNLRGSILDRAEPPAREGEAD